MMDEELYQHAADELNNGMRQPEIWAKACELAKDDHDEARYLYTSFRVEAMQEQREMGTLQMAEKVVESDSALDEAALEAALNETAPDSINAPQAEEVPVKDSALVDAESSDADEAIADVATAIPTLHASPVGAQTHINNQSEEASLETLHPVPDHAADSLDSTSLDDTFAGGDDTIDAFRKEIEAVKAEQSEYADYLDTGAFSLGLDNTHDATSDEYNADDTRTQHELDQTDLELDRTAEVTTYAARQFEHTQTSVPKQPQNQDTSPGLPDDLPPTVRADVQASEQEPATELTSDVLSAILDSEPTPPVASENFLQDNHDSSPSSNVLSQEALQWLDQSTHHDKDSPISAIQRTPLVNEQDQMRNAMADDSALDDTRLDDTSQIDTMATGAIPAAPSLDEVPTVAASIAATRSSMHTGAVAGPDTSTNDYIATSQSYPLDLSEDGHGKRFAVYRRDTSAQAVKHGVSWTALLLTLPYLIYRHMFGTAIVYGLLWIITLTGLVVSALAWIDAGDNVTPLVQASTIGFALLAFVGLVYLPFRYGNHWRGEKLEKRGYELIAIAKARSPGKAIAKVRAANGLP